MAAAPPPEPEPAPPLVMESLLLSVAHFWSRKERHFRQDEIISALKELMELLKTPMPKPRQQSVGRTATDAQATDCAGTYCAGPSLNLLCR